MTLFGFVGYVCFLMAANCLAFNIIVSCYLKMYCSIRGSQVWNSNDTRIAKRMALLVFTDFVCWAPISFFSLTAAFGHDLISLDDAKVFTIFVLPFNSCANPFLYAIFTKQFKKDCTLICKRIKSSRVSKGISRLSNRGGHAWGSSRRLSALNSFFTGGDRSRSRSRTRSKPERSLTISGASATHQPHCSRSSGTGKGSGSIVYIKRGQDDKYATVPDMAVHYKTIGNYLPNNLMHTDGQYHAAMHTRADNVCRCNPSNNKRGHPVGAGSSFLSLLKGRRGMNQGDGIDSDNEEISWSRKESSSWSKRESSSWSKRESSSWSKGSTSIQDPLGGRPLMSSSSGSSRRPNSSLHSELSSSVVTPKVHHIRPVPLPSSNHKKTVKLNCCNTSSHKRPSSPGPEYQIMWPTDESGYDGTQGTSSRQNESSSLTSANNELTHNNNHEYINITEDMITELRQIRTHCLPISRGLGRELKTDVCAPLALEEEDSSGVDVDDIRPEPEGSESKLALRPDKLDLVSTILNNKSKNARKKACHCKNPLCTDRKQLLVNEKHRNSNPEIIDGTISNINTDTCEHIKQKCIIHRSNSYESDVDCIIPQSAIDIYKQKSLMRPSTISSSLPTLTDNTERNRKASKKCNISSNQLFGREVLGQPVGFSPHITSFHLRKFLSGAKLVASANGYRLSSSDDSDHVGSDGESSDGQNHFTQDDVFDAADKIILQDDQNHVCDSNVVSDV